MDRMKEESSIPSWWSKNQKYLQIEQLDRTLVELFVKKMIVYKDHTMDVVWNFTKS